MATAEEILLQVADVEKNLATLDIKRLKIVNEIQSLRNKAESLKNQYNLLKSNEQSKKDWVNPEFVWNKKIKSVLINTFKLQNFRHQQLAAINAILSKQDVILLMPTGGGKSLCYQLPSLVLNGITLVISPLLSLIDDQMISLKKLKIQAVTLNSTNSKIGSKKVFEALAEGKGNIKIIYVTPEWMAKSKRFMSNLQKCYNRKALDLIAIDEVHCCSQWGHDFRPDYKFLGLLKNLFPDTPLMGLTATATEKIILDCQQMLDIQGCLILKASYNRPNLFYKVQMKPPTQTECLDLIEDLLRSKFKDKSGIIYTTTIQESIDLAMQLKKRGLSIACYHATMEADLRYKIHTKWLSKQYQAVVATVAFGMGIDKPDVRFVIHHCLPKSVESYYQESGRAGRDDKRAECILFYCLKDVFRLAAMVSTTQFGSANLMKMAEYCLDEIQCRRRLIADHFGDAYEQSHCDSMCDHCLTPRKLNTMDITNHYKDISQILEQSAISDNRLTALMLLDAWFQTGGSKSTRIKNLNKPMISRQVGERVIMFLLIKEYLKEDIHFTPYSTVIYLTKGRKSLDIDIIEMPVRGIRKEIVQLKEASKRKKDNEEADLKPIKKSKPYIK